MNGCVKLKEVKYRVVHSIGQKKKQTLEQKERDKKEKKKLPLVTRLLRPQLWSNFWSRYEENKRTKKKNKEYFLMRLIPRLRSALVRNEYL